MGNTNSGLGADKVGKNDEFYTKLTDIEKELRHYRKHLKDKTVLCNCDDPFESKVLVETSSVEHTEDLQTNQEVVDETEVVVDEKETGFVPENKDIISTEIPEDESSDSIWNFEDERIDFSVTNPTEVSYFGEGKECDGWQSAFLQIISFLHEDYPAIIRGMVGYRFAGVGKVILSGRAGIERFSKAEELNNGLYLETDCTPDEIVTIVRLLMNKCNMDYDNIEITYEQCQGENLADVEDDSAEPMADESQDDDTAEVTGSIDNGEEPSNEGVQDYIVQLLDEMNISYVDNRNNQGCLWIVGDERLSSVFNKFSQYKAVFHYKVDGGRATKGEPAWWTKDIIVTAEAPVQDVVEEVAQSNDDEKKNKAVIDSTCEGKYTFENWLISGAGLAERSAQSYSSAVNIAGQYSGRLGFSDKELYFILDAEQVYQISTKLLANPEFARLNEGQHNRYRAALSKYWDYCNALSGGAIVNAPIKATPEQEDEVKKNRIAFIAWAQAQQMQKAAILAYLSDIKKCSEFAKEHDYIKEEHILLIEDANVLECVFLEMRKDSRFVELNKERQKRPVSAMNNLIAFRRATNTAAVALTPAPQIKPVEKAVHRPIATVET
ncbi:MAG: hypothetical protein J6B85_04390, partial [Lachnospiraceae bacterium]|nr:hypothetical protein [Lachnospiraceae bacterium]